MLAASSHDFTKYDQDLSHTTINLMFAEIYRHVPETTTRVQYHLELQRRLKELGERLGYRARLEQPTPRIVNGRSGRLDVVWDAPAGGRSIAFEIDRSWRRRSIIKLLYMAKTHQPVWIFLGRRPMPFAPEEYDLGQIALLRADPDRLPKLRPRLTRAQARELQRAASRNFSLQPAA